MSGEDRRDFFVSYNGADRGWAEWIAWQLEEAGFSTVVQAWDLTEAHELLRRAITIDEKAYAADHPKLAVDYSNLATVEHGLGNLTEARELLRRTIAIEKKTYAADHPTLAVSYSNLATVEHGLGNLTEAIALARQAHSISLLRLGPSHAQTRCYADWLIRFGSDFDK